jgi:hypothetical protein
VSRTFIFAPRNDPCGAAKAIAAAGVSPDLVLVARLQPTFGASCFVLEEGRLDRLAGDLERALPLP